jgi:hypothetical protein
MSLKIATEDLRFPNGTLAYPKGAEVDSGVAASYGWEDLVVGPHTKAAKEAQEDESHTHRITRHEPTKEQ